VILIRSVAVPPVQKANSSSEPPNLILAFGPAPISFKKSISVLAPPVDLCNVNLPVGELVPIPTLPFDAFINNLVVPALSVSNNKSLSLPLAPNVLILESFYLTCT
jgi:hypothetical protein